MQKSVKNTEEITYLSHSSMSLAKTCLRKYYLRYVLGIRKDKVDQPLRMGSAVHHGLDILAKTNDIALACQAIRDNYADVPRWVEEQDELDKWLCECETCLRLLTCYHWRWADDASEIIESEIQFNLPILNPATGHPVRGYRFVGMIDKIVRLPDGRKAVREHKTTAEDLDAGGDYWKRLRIDSQISGYHYAAIQGGYEAETVDFDVIKKPTTKPHRIPILDGKGLKIVTDKAGARVYNKKSGNKPPVPRQSADKDKGYTMKQRMETPSEYGARLTKLISENPHDYFARQEIPRMTAELEEFQDELYQIQQTIHFCTKGGRWFRNTGACRQWGRTCEYFDICANSLDVTGTVPPGFIRSEHKHVELTVEGTEI